MRLEVEVAQTERHLAREERLLRTSGVVARVEVGFGAQGERSAEVQTRSDDLASDAVPEVVLVDGGRDRHQLSGGVPVAPGFRLPHEFGGGTVVAAVDRLNGGDALAVGEDLRIVGRVARRMGVRRAGDVRHESDHDDERDGRRHEKPVQGPRPADHGRILGSEIGGLQGHGDRRADRALRRIRTFEPLRSESLTGI